MSVVTISPVPTVTTKENPIVITKEDMDKVIKNMQKKEEERSVYTTKSNSEFSSVKSIDEDDSFWGQHTVLTDSSVITTDDPYRVVFMADNNLDIASIYNNKVSGRIPLYEFLGSATAIINVTLELVDKVLHEPSASPDSRIIAEHLGSALSNMFSESRSAEGFESDIGLDYGLDKCTRNVYIDSTFIPSNAGAGLGVSVDLDEYDADSATLIKDNDCFTNPYTETSFNKLWSPDCEKLLEEESVIDWPKDCVIKNTYLPEKPCEFFVKVDVFIDVLREHIRLTLFEALDPRRLMILDKLSSSVIYMCIATNSDLASTITATGYIDIRLANSNYVTFRDTLADAIAALCDYDSNIITLSDTFYNAEVEDVIDLIALEIDNSMYEATLQQD